MRQNVNNNSKIYTRYRLIELRKKRNLTQRKASSDLGISETYLRLLEKGQAAPSVELLFKTAHYYDTDVYDCWRDLSGPSPLN